MDPRLKAYKQIHVAWQVWEKQSLHMSLLVQVAPWAPEGWGECCRGPPGEGWGGWGEGLGHVELHWGLGDRLAACLKLGWEGSRI